MENKEITINDLAVMMKEGFENADRKMDDKLLLFEEKISKKTDEKIESLAAMVKVGFDGMDKRFEEVGKEIKEIKGNLIALERGQEDIKLRQDNSAYRFELEEQEKTLEKHDARIGVLEKKVLLAS